MLSSVPTLLVEGNVITSERDPAVRVHLPSIAEGLLERAEKKVVVAEIKP